MSWTCCRPGRPGRTPWGLHSPAAEHNSSLSLTSEQPLYVHKLNTGQGTVWAPVGPGAVRRRYLHRDAALQLELQLDHVHFLAGAELGQLGRARPHLVDGHVHGLQLHLPLPLHLDALFHVREGVGGWGRERTRSPGESCMQMWQNEQKKN